MTDEVIKLTINTKGKPMTIRINNVDFKIHIREPSYNQLFGDEKNFDYKRAVSEWIYRSIDDSQKGLITTEMIFQQNELFFEDFFKEYMNDNHELIECYNKINSSEEACKKFIDAYINYGCIALTKLSLKINTAFSDLICSHVDNFSKISDYITSFSEKYLESQLENFRNIATSLVDTINKIRIPQISEEQKNKRIDAYKKWGKFGWTPHPEASISYYDMCPNTQIDADKYALKMCDKYGMECLFKELSGNDKVSQRSISEAIICFHNKCNRACALILFSLIDRELIKLQKIDKEKKRATGAGAIASLKDKVEKENKEALKLLYFYLMKINLIAALFKIYSDTDDFKRKCDEPNRNYIAHGMSLKNVRKKDCIKLFLLYYNLLDFIETMDDNP